MKNSASPDLRRALVPILARAIAAAHGAGRVSTPALIAALDTVPGNPMTPTEIGRVLDQHGMQRAQWREDGGRVRGFVVPYVTEKVEKTTASPPCARE